MSKIEHILSVIHYTIHYTICRAVCFQFTHSPCDDWENIYTLSYYHHQIESMNYYPLFRVRSWNNDVRCMSFYILTVLGEPFDSIIYTYIFSGFLISIRAIIPLRWCQWKIIRIKCYHGKNPWSMMYPRTDSRLAPSQWEMSLQSNAVTHWPVTILESAMCQQCGKDFHDMTSSCPIGIK